MAHAAGALLAVDAAQTLGILPDMSWASTYWCFQATASTPGVGGLVLGDGLTRAARAVGARGTGSRSSTKSSPRHCRINTNLARPVSALPG